MENIGYVWPGMKKILACEAEQKLRNSEVVYELYDNNTHKRANINNFSSEKKYGIKYFNNFTLSEHLKNEYRVLGYVLFCKETEDTFVKLQVAYEWLIFIKNELSIIDKMKSREFIERIKKIKLDNKGAPQNDLIILWDEIQIFFQKICPNNWYFIKREYETYLFVYII